MGSRINGTICYLHRSAPTESCPPWLRGKKLSWARVMTLLCILDRNEDLHFCVRTMSPSPVSAGQYLLFSIQFSSISSIPVTFGILWMRRRTQLASFIKLDHFSIFPSQTREDITKYFRGESRDVDGLVFNIWQTPIFIAKPRYIKDTHWIFEADFYVTTVTIMVFREKDTDIPIPSISVQSSLWIHCLPSFIFITHWYLSNSQLFNPVHSSPGQDQDPNLKSEFDFYSKYEWIELHTKEICTCLYILNQIDQ